MILVGVLALGRIRNGRCDHSGDAGEAQFLVTNVRARRRPGRRHGLWRRPRRTSTCSKTTGTGVAAFDYDNDGWLDLFFVNGSTLEGFPPGRAPTNHLYRNRHDGTFEDDTTKAGLAASGWGQGACVGDYDNDGHDDLFVSYWGQNRLYHNRGNGTFERCHAQRRTHADAHAVGNRLRVPRLRSRRPARSVRRQLTSTWISPRRRRPSRACAATRHQVACGPPGLTGGKNVLYHNRGNGTFQDVSERAGITRAKGTYGLGVSTVDFDNDGWIDLYVGERLEPQRAVPQQP